MEIIEVTSPKLARKFLEFPIQLYKSEPRWIRPLDQEIDAVFDPKQNRSYRTGECIRWLLESDGKVIGRIAAFYDRVNARKGNEQPTGGIGFFECINNKEAAFLLFDTARNWLKQKGMEAMDGPINFGSRERWWGLLIDGYDRDPNYQANYHFPYYRELFESYGFQVYFYQYTFARAVKGPLSEKLVRKAQLTGADPAYRFCYPDKLDLDRIADQIQYVYNRAWAKRNEMPDLSKAQILHILKQMRPVMDKHLLWFGYYHDEPIAFFISIPEMNQIFKYVNGKLNWIGKLKFLWHVKRKTVRKAFGVLFGIVPEHQGKGVDGGLIMAFRKLLQEDYKRYDEYEMGWIGDFNPKMIKVAEQIETDIVKTHATFRKLFDDSKPFKRMRII